MISQEIIAMAYKCFLVNRHGLNSKIFYFDFSDIIKYQYIIIGVKINNPYTIQTEMISLNLGLSSSLILLIIINVTCQVTKH